MLVPNARAHLRKRLKQHEGLRHKVYKDTHDIPTIGIGRNLQDKGLSDAEIDLLFSNDVRDAELEARRFPAWETLNQARRTVLTEMVFQMGYAGVKGFKKALQAMEDRFWDEAHDEMLDSDWARYDSPSRALRLAQIMKSGEYDD